MTAQFGLLSVKLLKLFAFISLFHYSQSNEPVNHSVILQSCRPISLTVPQFGYVSKIQSSMVVIYSVPNSSIPKCRSCKIVEMTVNEVCKLCKPAKNDKILTFVRLNYDDKDVAMLKLFKELGITEIPAIEFWYSGKRFLASSNLITKPSRLTGWLTEISSGQYIFMSSSNDTLNSLLLIITLMLFLTSIGAFFIYLVNNVYWMDILFDYILTSNRIGILCLSIIFTAISGQMWNHMRGAPFIHFDAKEKAIGFISKGTSSQLMIESYIILLIYAIICRSLIYVDDLVHHRIEKQECITQAEARNSMTGIMVFVIASSSLMTLYRMKV
ncbi:hypothetical protein GJ496_000122 [Pomphorhynchus laevis]|nr:hypothetical protein GJ496_000122 [Pomphorhynchus laevis]